jgi:hypothetical protein
MFDTELTERHGDVPAPFSNENPLLEVSLFIASDYVSYFLVLISFFLLNPGGLSRTHHGCYSFQR